MNLDCGQSSSVDPRNAQNEIWMTGKRQQTNLVLRLTSVPSVGIRQEIRRSI